MAGPDANTGRGRADKVMSMHDAVAAHVRDGDTVALGGFTHLVPTAAGHEIIRQRRKDLTLVRLALDVVSDQMVAAGCVRKIIASFVGSSAGSLGEVRRRLEAGTLELEEYSHYGMICRYLAGAQRLPFYPIRSYAGSDLPSVNPNIRTVTSPYPGPDGPETVYVVPPLHPDVAIVHAQRADAAGNTQIWGITGIQAEVIFAARRSIIVVEEIVDEAIVRSDPNRTLIPALAVDTVVECPRGAHPSFAQGYYDRDNAFYRTWPQLTKDPLRLQAWLDEWIRSTADHAAYVDKMGADVWDRLAVGPAMSTPVNYGRRL